VDQIHTSEPIDERDIFAAQYIAGNEGQIEELYPIESDEEWEFVEEVLNTL